MNSVSSKNEKKSVKQIWVIGPRPLSENEIQYLKSHLKKEHAFLLVDGGAKHLFSKGKQRSKNLQTILKPKNVALPQSRQPSVIWVGDADGLDPKTFDLVKRTYRPEIIQLPTAKDLSDTAFALNCIQYRFNTNTVTFIGFAGGLLDHELAFISDIFSFLKSFKTITCEWIRSDSRVFFLSKCSTTDLKLTLGLGKRVSIVPYDDFISIRTMTGFKYFAKKISRSSHGISNLTNAKKQVIQIHSGQALVFCYA